MTANGLAKLIEECGELQQVAGKRLAYYRTDEHPDGGSSLRDRMECEIADVMAACAFYAKAAGLNLSHIEQRRLYKERLFECWHEASDNNAEAIDGKSPSLETKVTHSLPDHPSAPPCICTPINEPQAIGMRTHSQCPQHGYLICRNDNGTG